jgi:hypothetical protein
MSKLTQGNMRTLGISYYNIVLEAIGTKLKNETADIFGEILCH